MEKKFEIIPYLSFRGNCEDALHTYMEAFGGEILYLSRWSKDNCEVPEQVGKVMHVEFLLGCTRISAGDSFDTQGGNTDIKLMVHMESMEEALHAIEALAAEGGTVLSPQKPHPAPDDSGCGSITRDRFGYLWIVTCPNPDKQ